MIDDDLSIVDQVTMRLKSHGFIADREIILKCGGFYSLNTTEVQLIRSHKFNNVSVLNCKNDQDSKVEFRLTLKLWFNIFSIIVCDLGRVSMRLIKVVCAYISQQISNGGLSWHIDGRKSTSQQMIQIIHGKQGNNEHYACVTHSTWSENLTVMFFLHVMLEKCRTEKSKIPWENWVFKLSFLVQ